MVTTFQLMEKITTFGAAIFLFSMSAGETFPLFKTEVAPTFDSSAKITLIPGFNDLAIEGRE